MSCIIAIFSTLKIYYKIKKIHKNQIDIVIREANFTQPTSSNLNSNQKRKKEKVCQFFFHFISMALKRLLTISFVNLLKKEQKSFRIIKHSRLKSFTVDIFFVLFSFHLVIKYISMAGCTECTLKLKSKQKSKSNMINLTTQNESLVFVFLLAH